jgi:ribulose-phosphate 3-epimerase
MAGKKLFDELKGACPVITVGVLTADMMHLGSELAEIERAGVKLLHIDVMDGCFCPMMTLGPPFIKGLKTPLLKDVHLMIEEPLDKLESFVAAGADIITINVESCRHLHRALQMLGEMENVNDAERGILRGIVLNPATPLDLAESVLDEVEMVFLLAVNPGFSGQKLIPSTKGKLARLKELIGNAKKEVLVGIDGGVKKSNIAEIAAMGPDIVVTGSAVFDGKAPHENAKFMMEALNKGSKR